MAVRLGLSVVGVIAGVIGLARVLVPALRTDMEAASVESLRLDAFESMGMLVLSVMVLFLLPKARRQGRDRLARVNALNLVIIGMWLMLACRRQWFGPEVPGWLGGICSGVAFAGWIILRGQEVKASSAAAPGAPPPTPR